MPISAPGNTLNQRGGTVLITPLFVQEKGDALMPALSEVLSATRTISYSALSCACLSCIKQQRQLPSHAHLTCPSWFENRRHPDWFRENANSLEPILQKRSQLYLRWLGSCLSSDRQNFSKARSKARRAVRAAKNTWFTSKAEEAQMSRL